jgi:hypothetical protein
MSPSSHHRWPFPVKTAREQVTQKRKAEPVDEVDWAGMVAFREMKSLRPARQLISVVRQQPSEASTNCWLV